VIAVGAAVGFALARRATRPVDEAIRAIEAIAAGEADYSFSWRTEDRLEELPQAFSMLHRSLDDQQRRRAAAERVAAWREVARRVAHEIKNPLAPIRITVQNLVKARRQAPEVFDEILDEGSKAILEEVDQLQRIVTEFSEFARLPEPRWKPTDLDEIVDEVVALYSGAPGIREIRLRGDAAPRLNSDAGLLSRAIKNLVANAVEAMGERGGILTVETGHDRGSVFVSVRDTGPGFSDESAARAFEPYFTTKAKGTGLGMAIADRIVTEHGGFIVASNLAGGGAEVVVKLPARVPAEESS
jgi:nitrogen fixation/metabolism regulation signal transduction histidine kinase